MATQKIHMRQSLLALATLIACTSASAETPNPERNAYFGEQHIHTSWSVDAWLFGNHLTGPKEAYEYAKGTTIKHPQGYNIQIEQPLDWMGVTDHSEYVCVTKMANKANEPGKFTAFCSYEFTLQYNNSAPVEKLV